MNHSSSRIGLRRKKINKSPKKKYDRNNRPVSESVLLMRHDLSQLTEAVENQQYNMKAIIDRLNSTGNYGNIPTRPPQAALIAADKYNSYNRFGNDYDTNNNNNNNNNNNINNHGNSSNDNDSTILLQNMQEQIMNIAETQKKLSAKVYAYEKIQVAGADVNDDWELIKREQRILTDHVGRLSQAVMELKTSKRSDALAAAAQIRNQAEETMDGIRKEVHVMREENANSVNNMETKLLAMENNFQATLDKFRNEYDGKINNVRREAESSFESIKRELENTLVSVKHDLVFNNNYENKNNNSKVGRMGNNRIDVFSKTPERLKMQTPRHKKNSTSPTSMQHEQGSGSETGFGNSFTGSSPLKATSIRTVALDNELKLLEEKIKFAQESILKGYNI